MPTNPTAGMCARLSASTELNWRLIMLGCFFVGWLMLFAGAAEGGDGEESDDGTPGGNVWRGCKWHMLYWYSALLILTAQMSNQVREFFTGEGVGFIDLWKWYVKGIEMPKLSDRLLGKGADVDERAQVGFWTLMSSAFITWIFAKSINNAAIYGGRYGIMGGVGYAGWYLSFHSAAFVGYMLRTRGGYRSMPTVINKLFGPSGSVCLNLALVFRLWNEVWSNTLVIADFFGPYKSVRWWAAGIMSAAVPAIYVMMGGMRASLISDMLQAFIGIVFLFTIIGMVGGEMGDTSLWDYQPPGGWYEGRGFVVLAASIQGLLSYPFHDPVLTDRAFLAKPRTMVKAFFVGGSIAIMFIILFASIGIFGDFIAGGEYCSGSSSVRQSWTKAEYLENTSGGCRCNKGDLPGSCGLVNKGSASGVANVMGGAFECFILFVMMTSSLSTLDSTFTSIAKLVPLELGGWFRISSGDKRSARGPMAPLDPNVSREHILLGRVAIFVLAVCGTLYMEMEGDAVKATTISGIMVLGLGPPVYLSLLWKYNSKPGANDGWRRSPLAFVLSFLMGVFFGSVAMARSLENASEAVDDLYKSTPMGYGSFEYYLGWTVTGQLSCFGACALGFIIHQVVPMTEACDAEPTTEDPHTGARIPRPGYELVAAASALGPAAEAPRDPKDVAYVTSSTAGELTSYSTC